MITAVYIVIYILFGLISGFFYKTTLSRRGSGLGTYLLIGVTSAVICGLAGEALLAFGYVENEHRGSDYINPDSRKGDLSFGFTYDGWWLSLLISLLGALLALTVYKIRDTYRHPE